MNYLLGDRVRIPSRKNCDINYRPLKKHISTVYLYDTSKISPGFSIQFLPELSRFLRDKGEWEPQNTVVRKGRGEFLTPFSPWCFEVPILLDLSKT